jgi:hypothetical protein
MKEDKIMTTYKLLKLLIEKNRYTYEDMMRKLDLFFAIGRITEEEYVELTGLLTKPDEDTNGEV